MTSASLSTALRLGGLVATIVVVHPACALDAGSDGPTCTYDNYLPLDDFGSPAGQVEGDYPFFAEAADDFILPGNRGNLCRLEEVVFAVTFFNTPGNPAPQDCWESVIVTIYEDIGAGTNDGDPSRCPTTVGPAGWPDDEALPEIEHEDCLFQIPGVRCEFTVPMTQVQTTPLDLPCVADAWEARLTDLSSLKGCFLEPDRLYWIAIAPTMPMGGCGQTAIMHSQQVSGNPAMQIFHLLDINPWSIVDGNTGTCDPAGHPAGLARDLAIAVTAIELVACPADLNHDGFVNASDLAVLLGSWGPCTQPSPCPADLNRDMEVNAADLAILLGSWETCR